MSEMAAGIIIGMLIAGALATGLIGGLFITRRLGQQTQPNHPATPAQETPKPLPAKIKIPTSAGSRTTGGIAQARFPVSGSTNSSKRRA